MQMLKDLAAAGAGLLVFFVVSGGVFGDDEPRFEASLYDSTLYAPKDTIKDATKAEDAAELRYPRDTTPADRVREVFARFGPDDGKRGKRYASAATVIR
jgi:hypothetical protein